MLLKRKCPDCNKKLIYMSKDSYKNAIKNKSVCIRCRSVKSGFLDRYCTIKNSGTNNSFFGKHHSKKTKELLKNRNTDYTQTKQFRQKMSKVTSGKNNGMYGKIFYKVWVEKYGKNKADKLMKKHQNKMSFSFSGKNNPMFGKPAPIGSGNGWGCWYKNIYFRSLRELSFFVNEIERKKMIWRTAECKELGIPYKYRNKNRTYFADFLINNKILIEIKPKLLQNLEIIKIKINAAKQFCKQKNLIYKITDYTILSNEKINQLYNDKLLKFLPKYRKQFIKKFHQLNTKGIYDK